MENAVDALKIAAAVLIFVIAIGSSFSLFGTAKHTADSIITMRDKQAYLESADLDGGILYTSSSKIQENDEGTETSVIGGVTTKGDRIVSVDDVISTIYRYSKEKYGVTIINESSKVIARYDSTIDQIMTLWSVKINNEDGNLVEAVSKGAKGNYIEKVKEHISTKYRESPSITITDLEKLYKITIPGHSIEVGAPWYGNEEQIRKKIACDINGNEYIYNKQSYNGINLLKKLEGKTIVEVTNEIDNSTYLKDGEETTDLLQQYEMPTIEIVYIILD